jgi:hypothetical protein
MKTGFVGIVALVFAASTLASALAQRRGPAREDGRQASQQHWLSSLDEGMAEARKTGKPLMVVIRCVP